MYMYADATHERRQPRPLHAVRTPRFPQPALKSGRFPDPNNNNNNNNNNHNHTTNNSNSNNNSNNISNNSMMV